MFINELFDEAVPPIGEAKRPFKQGTVLDYPAPKKLNKGIDKIYQAVLQQQVDRENGEGVKPVRAEVAVVVDAHPGKLSYGILKRIGRSGLFHVKLNGGKLKDWANGDEIAVQPHEVYATWDPKLQGMTTVHREYNDDGSKAVREVASPYEHGYDHGNRTNDKKQNPHKPGQKDHDDYERGHEEGKSDWWEEGELSEGPEEHFAKDPSGYMRNMHTGRLEGEHWSAIGDKPTGRYAKRLERYAKERAEREAKVEPVAEAYALKKRVKIVGAPAPHAWIGKYGWIGEIRHGLYKGAPKTYTVDLDHGGGSIMLPREALRLVKDPVVDEGWKEKVAGGVAAAALAGAGTLGYQTNKANAEKYAGQSVVQPQQGVKPLNFSNNPYSNDTVPDLNDPSNDRLKLRNIK